MCDNQLTASESQSIGGWVSPKNRFICRLKFNPFYLHCGTFRSPTFIWSTTIPNKIVFRLKSSTFKSPWLSFASLSHSSSIPGRLHTLKSNHPQWNLDHLWSIPHKLSVPPAFDTQWISLTYPNSMLDVWSIRCVSLQIKYMKKG